MKKGALIAAMAFAAVAVFGQISTAEACKGKKDNAPAPTAPAPDPSYSAQ